MVVAEGEGRYKGGGLKAPDGQDYRVPVLSVAEILSALGTVVCAREREVRLSEGPFHT